MAVMTNHDEDFEASYFGFDIVAQDQTLTLTVEQAWLAAENGIPQIIAVTEE